MNTDTLEQDLTPDQVLEFAKFPEFRRRVAEIVNESPRAREIRDMIELRCMLEETHEH